MAVKRRVAGSIQDGGDLDAPSSLAAESPDFWTAERELELMHTMIRHKPAGISKHFQMAAILHKLSANPDFKNIKSSSVWKHLDTLYDMKAVDEVETAANEQEEQSEFTLPLKDFHPALTEMKRTSGIQIEDAFGGEKSTKPSEETPKSSTSKRPTRSTPNAPSASKRRK